MSSHPSTTREEARAIMQRSEARWKKLSRVLSWLSAIIALVAYLDLFVLPPTQDTGKILAQTKMTLATITTKGGPGPSYRSNVTMIKLDHHWLGMAYVPSRNLAAQTSSYPSLTPAVVRQSPILGTVLSVQIDDTMVDTRLQSQEFMLFVVLGVFAIVGIITGNRKTLQG